ncbi:hypothetical protein [Streptococcus danieliae]|uniref:hypothetical protein n=1 Tax=Streptococcus danieliae TaxID=747656 RepID=UPI0021C70A28|nr:hypothetical protein [Streptococcus danieliae]MCU0082472.1 hypothetical protein [Streptococcus danieliae]
MDSKYYVNGEVTKDRVTLNFGYTIDARNEYMAAIWAARWIGQAFGVSSVEVLNVELWED